MSTVYSDKLLKRSVLMFYKDASTINRLVRPVSGLPPIACTTSCDSVCSDRTSPFYYDLNDTYSTGAVFRCDGSGTIALPSLFCSWAID